MPLPSQPSGRVHTNSVTELGVIPESSSVNPVHFDHDSPRSSQDISDLETQHCDTFIHDDVPIGSSAGADLEAYSWHRALASSASGSAAMGHHMHTRLAERLQVGPIIR